MLDLDGKVESLPVNTLKSINEVLDSFNKDYDALLNLESRIKSDLVNHYDLMVQSIINDSQLKIKDEHLPIIKASLVHEFAVNELSDYKYWDGGVNDALLKFNEKPLNERLSNCDSLIKGVSNAVKRYIPRGFYQNAFKFINDSLMDSLISNNDSVIKVNESINDLLTKTLKSFNALCSEGTVLGLSCTVNECRVIDSWLINSFFLSEGVRKEIRIPHPITAYEVSVIDYPLIRELQVTGVSLPLSQGTNFKAKLDLGVNLINYIKVSGDDKRLTNLVSNLEYKQFKLKRALKESEVINGLITDNGIKYCH